MASPDKTPPPSDLLVLADKNERLLAEVVRLRQALTAMVYVHPCNCGTEIPESWCARCRSVELLGFDPCVVVEVG